MALKTLETAASQVKSAAGNAAAGAGAHARRETSITGWANTLLAKSVRQTRTRERPRQAGVYALSEEEVRASRMTGGQVVVTSDGYVRKSPAQPLVTSPDYHRRIARRVILTAAAAVIVILAVYAVTRLGLTALS